MLKAHMQHVDYKILTDWALELLACDHSSSTALHKCFEIQLLLTRAVEVEYHVKHQRLSFSSEGQRDKTWVTGELHPVSSFDF